MSVTRASPEAPVTPAERLEEQYTRELQLTIREGGSRGLEAADASWMLHAAGRKQHRARSWRRADTTTWVWSDPHLGHERSLKAFHRPFRNAGECDAALWTAWHDSVRPGDDVICLGDVTVDGEADSSHHEAWSRAPGTKWLVLGNHDAVPGNRVRAFQTTGTTIALYAPGDPALVLTHVPLRKVPAGTVNVHGHLHHHRSPSHDGHINVSVEQLGYRPARLDQVRRLARDVLAGRTRPGETTRAALERSERRTAADQVSETRFGPP